MRSHETTHLLLAVIGIGWCGLASAAYYGKEIGALSQLHHGVRGKLYAIDSRTLYLQHFHYDGEGPAAYFYVGWSRAPGADGVRLRDERGSSAPLRRYRGESLTLSLPEGKTLRDIKWFSVWCDDFSVNFGDISIPRELEYPRPVKVGSLRGVHGVSSSPLVVVDAQTLLVPNFSYDGEAPDAKFWVGRGAAPSPQGIRIPDENGKETPLRRYDNKTIVLTLPGELTVFDIGHFAVWCEAFTVNFGHVSLPRRQLASVPPSLKMLGVSPQSRNKELAAGASDDKPAAKRRPAPAPGRLDATTYRPQLRPGAGPLASLVHPPAEHAAISRRADTYSPPATQLLHDEKESHLKLSQTHQKINEHQHPEKLANYQLHQEKQQLNTQPDYQQQQKLQQMPQQQNQRPVTQIEDVQEYRQLHGQQPQLNEQIKYVQQKPQSNYQQLQKLQQNYQQQQDLPQRFTIHHQQNPQTPIYYQHQQLVQPNNQAIYQQAQLQPDPYSVQTETYQQQRSQELYYPDLNNQQIYQSPHSNEELLQQRTYEQALLNQQYHTPQYRLIPYNTGRY